MRENDKGFSLIEMAVVLVIMGLIIGTVVPLLVSKTEQAKLKEGREIVRTARDEIVGYAINYGCLPENLIGHSKDPWNKRLFYRVATNGSGVSLACTGPSELICNSTNSSLKINENTTTKDDIAFVVASGGANYNKQINNGTNLITTYAFGEKVDSYTNDFNRTTDKYDDILEYVTLDYLRSQLECESVNSDAISLNASINNPDACTGTLGESGKCDKEDLKEGWKCVLVSGNTCDVWVKK